MSLPVNFPPERVIPILSTMPEKLKDFDLALGRAIRSARNERGWSQERLAEKIDVKRAAISNYERGNRPVPARILAKISIALQVKPGYFFPEAEAAGIETRGLAAARQYKIEQIHGKLGQANTPTLDMILTVLDLGRAR